MKVIKNTTLFFFSILALAFTACVNEPLDPDFSNYDPENPSNPSSNSSLVGTWSLVSFDLATSTEASANGMPIQSDLQVVSFNPNYNVIFTENSFTTNGGYEYTVDIVANGTVIPSENYEMSNVNGNGTYTTTATEITTNGSFFEFEFEGVDDSAFDGPQTNTYAITNNGQTLTLSKNSTEVDSSSGIEVTTTTVAISVWSRAATNNLSCAEATTAANTAETAYNANTTDASLCNAYKTALQTKITACGDATGSIQAIIDGLSCGNNGQDLLLKKMIWTELDGTVETEEFFYDGNNLTSITLDGELANTYIYENNLLTRINSYGANEELIDYVITEYNSNNQLIVYTVYIVDNNQGFRYELTYNADGTITGKKYSGDFNSQTSFVGEEVITMQNNQILVEDYLDGSNSTYTYDTKNGIYKNISNLQTINIINIDFSGYIDGGQNNILSLNENENGSVLNNEEYVYTYNSNNYPETSNDYVDGDLDTTRQYLYY